MSYSGIFSPIVTYLELCVTIAYSKSCHIVNLRYIQDSVKLSSNYAECCERLHFENTVIFRTLPYSKFCIFRTQENSEPCCFRHIWAY